MKERRDATFAAGAILNAACAVVWQTLGTGPLAQTLAAAAPAPPTRAPQGARVFAIDPQTSAASYHVGETFFRNHQFEVAVGVTHGIQGAIYLDRAYPDQSRVGRITINVNQLTSDSS
ncbi:MAG TPA: hypothetical protein VGX75_06555 [bacterium]|nr:hypothetical protein [bacterium]